MNWFIMYLFQGGFDFSTWDWTEYSIIGGGVLLIVIIILSFILRGNKKVSFQNAYKSLETGEGFVVKGQNLWFRNEKGLTDLYTAKDGKKVSLRGKVVYIVKELNNIIVSQEGNQLVRTQERGTQYITFDFVSKDEVIVGTRTFISETELDKRAAKQKKAQEKAAKLEAAREKKEEKLAKKNAKKDKKKTSKQKDEDDDSEE